MSDSSVCAALRSDAPLVVIEAPAGCGKTFQAAEYAGEITATKTSSRLLVLTHTHAACSVFSDRTKAATSRVEIRTIDGIIAQIASAYHSGLSLPSDIAAWIRQQQDGHAVLAMKVASLLRRHPMIAESIAQRYRVIICDEHQDSSGDQHSIVMALLNRGAKIRLFADPMQRIFRDSAIDGACLPCDWNALIAMADAFEQLDTPHRWSTGCADLGQWTLNARTLLKNGGRIDLRGNLPPSVEVLYAENQAQKALDYQLSFTDRKKLDTFEKTQSSVWILTHHNRTALSFRGFFNRKIPLWEGHTRTALDKLANAICAHHGNPVEIASSIVQFLADVGKGFSPSAFGDRFEQEVQEGCTKKCKGKPATLQELAQCLVLEADHRGVSKLLHRLLELRTSDSQFANIEIDCYKEFWEAVRLGNFDTVDEGLAEINHRRTYSRPKPPDKAISTIHKAKGQECESVVVMPCDAKTFPDKRDARCLLYVALSRAKKRLFLVVSRNNPSPLLEI